MTIFHSIIERLRATRKRTKKPSNIKLLRAIREYRHRSYASNHAAVVHELMHGNAFLLLPTTGGPPEPSDWEQTQGETNIQITSVFEHEDGRILGAFTSEKALSTWAKKPTAYTALESKHILDFCTQNQIQRIVIDDAQSTMFVMDWESEGATA